MDGFVDTILSEYGVFAVFFLLLLSGFGIPLGEEVINIPAGALIAHDALPWWPTLGLAYLGVVIADFIWYVICRHFGTRLLTMRFIRRIVHPRRLLEVKHQMDQRGVWLIVAARFIPGSRSSAITVAGMFHMHPGMFMIATSLCVMITAPLQIALGFWLGTYVHTDGTDTGELLLRVLGLVVLIIVLLGAVNVWRAYRASKHRPKRARARWLREGAAW
jgi:membrane protein DedA with SNARE-associated domain